jgi:chorismate synthase
MNRFGVGFSVEIFGESHGQSLGVVVDGCPAGLPLGERDLEADLKRRKPGAPGTTARKERDRPRLLSGVFQGLTTGAPILILFDNEDADPAAYKWVLRTPRPGHADLSAFLKFGGNADYRGGGHFSGRLTAGLVAAGAIAKKLLAPMEFRSTLVEVGGRQDIEEAVREALALGDSVGGLVECRMGPVPGGLGEPFFDSVESVLAHGLFSIPAIRGVEFGAGFSSAAMRGSLCNDPICDASGTTSSNNAGGINGGLSNGNEIVLRVAVKPPSSVAIKQETVDLCTGKKVELRTKGRHDACIALRVPVVVEAVCAIGLADLASRQQLLPRIWAKKHLPCD